MFGQEKTKRETYKSATFLSLERPQQAVHGHLLLHTSNDGLFAQHT